MRSHLVAVEKPPEYLEGFFGALKKYAVSRESAWESLVTATRAKGPERKALFAEYHRAEERARSDQRELASLMTKITAPPR
jgi:hypothetical protein